MADVAPAEGVKVAIESKEGGTKKAFPVKRLLPTAPVLTLDIDIKRSRSRMHEILS